MSTGHVCDANANQDTNTSDWKYISPWLLYAKVSFYWMLSVVYRAVKSVPTTARFVYMHGINTSTDVNCLESLKMKGGSGTSGANDTN